jgi:2-polyprenyl-6-methoxyphenol hydroxylase-like FAD-dependent oxidoreductase
MMEETGMNRSPAPTALTTLIVGGGIGGLATALAFQRNGISALVFERAREFREVGAGLILTGSAVTALHKLGLAEALHTIAAPLHYISLRTWRGDVLVAVPLQDARMRFGASAVAVQRGELQAALVQALQPQRLHMNMQGIGFEQDAEGVCLRFASGEARQGDLLVGADGLHSVIRAQLVGAATPRYAGYTVWRGVTPFALDPREEQTTFETWGAGKRFGCVPLTHGRVYWFAVANARAGEREATAEQEKRKVAELVSSCHEPAAAVVAATDASAIVRTDIYDRPVRSCWSQGRVTLLGDAAHPMTPNLAQGACQAIEDAYILAESLKSTPTITAALQRYEARRISRANAMVQRSRQQGRIAQWEQPWAVSARNTMMRMAPARLLRKQLAWIAGNQI